MESFNEIQIRPPVTDKEKEKYDKQEKFNKENSDSDFASNVEVIGSYLSHVLDNKNSYTETIALDADGEIDKSTFMHNAGRTILESANSVEISRKGLNKLIKGIKEKYELLRFSIKENDNSILLTAHKIKKDTFVKWTSQGVDQWSTSKRVVHIDGEYAFVDGSQSGIPVAELEVEE